MKSSNYQFKQWSYLQWWESYYLSNHKNIDGLNWSSSPLFSSVNYRFSSEEYIFQTNAFLWFNSIYFTVPSSFLEIYYKFTYTSRSHASIATNFIPICFTLSY